MSTTVANPDPHQARLTIPKGTPVSSMHPSWEPAERRPAGRTYTVTVRSALPGWVDLDGGRHHEAGRIALPVVRWPGKGSYWTDTQVTNELLAANGLPPLTLPTLDEDESRRLRVPLSFDRGSTNQW